jgi:hypothetical protein
MRYPALMLVPRRLFSLCLLTACAGADAGGQTGLSLGAAPTTLSAGDELSSGTGSSGSVTATSSGETGGTTSAAMSGTGTSGTSGTSGASEESSAGGESSGEPLPPVRTCTFPATPPGPLELKVPKGSGTQLKFTAKGLPDPSTVEAATLRFTSYDADHPGEEGVIVVNGGAALDLPAALAWENKDHATEVVLPGPTVAGDNLIAFGAGSFVDGSFYRISQVALELEVHLEECPPAPMGPPKSVQIGYEDAVYTRPHNWVLRCDYDEGYAFTAKGDQAMLDCSELYAPDGTRKGTATFTFLDLPPANYQVSIKSRHSANRNPIGALFVVAGEGKRVDQLEGDMVVDIWGTKQLAGTITVVLDSDKEGASDSVTWVRLDPV